MATVLKSGFIVPIAVLTEIYGAQLDEILREKLHITYTPKVGKPTVIVLYRRVNYRGKPYIHVPRKWLQVLVIENGLVAPPKIIFPPIKTAKYEFYGTLDANQRIVVDYVMQHEFTAANIARGTAAALLNLLAGSGKTFVAAALIARMGWKCLYITMNRPLKLQAISDLKSVLRGNIGDYKRGSTYDCAVIIINSAMTMSLEERAQFSFVIYDEVQSYASDTRRAIFRDTMTWANLGMSATTNERKDGSDGVYHKELALRGEIKAANLPGYALNAVAFDITVRLIHYYGPPEFTKALTHESTGKIFTPYMQKQFMSDPTRTQAAADALRALYDWEKNGKRHNIFVFCEERSQLDVIWNAFKDTFPINVPELDVTAGRFVGGIKDAEARRMRDECRIYLTTYAYSSTGISNNSMTAMLFMTPRREKMIQIIGRILRRNGDVTIPRIIVDIIDENSALRGQATSRREAYDTRPDVKYEHITVRAEKLG